MSTPQEALSAAIEHWNADDLDGYLSLYDEGVRLHGYPPEPMDPSNADQRERLGCVRRYGRVSVLVALGYQLRLSFAGVPGAR